jgi:hypothetical protein
MRRQKVKMTGTGVSGVEPPDFLIVLVCSPAVLNIYRYTFPCLEVL